MDDGQCKIIIDKIRSLYQNKCYSISKIAEELGISANKVRYWLEKNNIPRRNKSEAGYLAHIQRFNKLPCRIKIKLTAEEKKLLIIGVILYATEGSRRDKKTVNFSNSDPKLVQLFLRFLREICRVYEERLRIIPHFYTYQDENGLKECWSRFTRIPLTQFCKSYIHIGKNGTYKRKSEYGTVTLRYNDKHLAEQIF